MLHYIIHIMYVFIWEKTINITMPKKILTFKLKWINNNIILILQSYVIVLFYYSATIT